MEKKNWLTVYCGIDSVPASLVSHESWQGLIRAQNPAEGRPPFIHVCTVSVHFSALPFEK